VTPLPFRDLLLDIAGRVRQPNDNVRAEAR
jgi:hypothetical protein